MLKLRFCLVSTFYPPHHFGGDAVFVYRLAEALASLGHSVHVLYSLDAFGLKAMPQPDVGFTHHPKVTRFPLATASPRWSTLSVHQLGRPAAYGETLEAHFSAHEYDVIHYHNVSLMGAPALLRLGHAVKLHTTHEYWLVCPTHVLFKFNREACTSRECIRCTLRSGRPPQWWRSTGLLRACLTELDALIMPSQFALERHQQDGISGHMQVIPHFVPVPSDAELAARLPDPERPFFLYVGRLEKLKGVQDLLAIFDDYRAADLLIVGAGAYEPELRAAAKDSPHVKFLGAMHPQAIGIHYRQAIAVLVPSLCFETFALIAAEALAHGTPVIGRRIGAIAELLDASGGGIAFDTKVQCRVAMEKLLGDPALRIELGTRGRQFALQQWTLAVHLERYLALISERMKLRAGRQGMA